MREGWRRAAIGDLAIRHREPVKVANEDYYRLMGIRWRNLGPYVRGDSVSTPSKTATLYRISAGDFVFNKIDTDKGAFGVVPPELDGVLASNEFPAYTFSDDLIPEYLWLVFQQNQVLRGLRPAGSDGRARWKDTDFERFTITVPPRSSQRRILDLFRTLDVSIQRAASAYEAAHQVEGVLREHLLRGSVQFPVGAILVKLRKPVDVDPCATYTEIGIRSHGRGYFIKEPLSGADLGKKKVFWMQPGTLAFSVVFSWEGAVAELDEGVEGLIASHRFPNFTSEHEAGVRLMSNYFHTQRGRSLLVKCSPGGAGWNKTLNFSRLMETAVSLPPQCRWREIVETLDAAKERAAAAARYEQSLRSLRENLLTALLSGEHEIPESYDELLEGEGAA